MTNLERKFLSHVRQAMLVMPRNTPPRLDWHDRAGELVSEYMINEAREQEGRPAVTTKYSATETLLEPKQYPSTTKGYS